MRAPSSTLVLDAAVLVASARGRSLDAILTAAGAASLVTTGSVVHEARGGIELGLKHPELLEVHHSLIGEMTVAPSLRWKRTERAVR